MLVEQPPSALAKSFIGSLCNAFSLSLTGAAITLFSVSSAIADPSGDCTAAYDQQEYAKAIELCRPLAEQGEPKPQAVLGLMYMRGQGVEHDDLEAADWFRKAAEQGDGTGEAWLGFSYFVGFGGVPEDLAEAMRWYRKAAKQGNATGEEGLGTMFAGGMIVQHDDEQAAMWFRKAAQQGDAAAQHDLGAAYEYGHGVPRDYVLAYMWQSLASAPKVNVGLVAKSALDGLAKQMTLDQIAEAQKMAREWNPTK
jgi:TPR repeat protein